MNINSNTIKKIIEIEDLLDISSNKLLLIVMALGSGKSTVLKSMLEEKNILKEEFRTLLDILSQGEFLTKKDHELILKLDKTKIIDKEDYERLIHEVLEHLNAITQSRKRVTEERKKNIIKWLRKGFSIDQFRKVNLYFFFKWNNNPEMEKYIRPETLYNKNFEMRVEEAEKEFEKLEIYLEDIQDICKSYKEFFENYILNGELKYLNQKNFLEHANKDLCKYIPFNIQQKIAFWRKKGFSKEDILCTIEQTISQWSKKQELFAQINLLKILDNKFPERVEVSKRLALKVINESPNENMSNLKDWYQSS